MVVEAWYLLPVKEYEQNPSVLADHMPMAKVLQLRRQGSRFIQDIGHHLRFPLRTIATGQLYFHLFFARHSMAKYPPLDIALTAVIVASKAEETFKKIRQILTAAFLILNPQFKGTEIDVKIVEEHRKRAIQYEDVLLETIKFNFSLSHAYEDLIRLNRLFPKTPLNIVKEAYSLLQSLYHTSIILHYPPHYLALVCLMEATQRAQADTGELLRWADDNQINRVDLSQIMDRLEDCMKAVEK